MGSHQYVQGMKEERGRGGREGEGGGYDFSFLYYLSLSSLFSADDDNHHADDIMCGSSCER